MFLQFGLARSRDLDNARAHPPSLRNQLKADSRSRFGLDAGLFDELFRVRLERVVGSCVPVRASQ